MNCPFYHLIINRLYFLVHCSTAEIEKLRQKELESQRQLTELKGQASALLSHETIFCTCYRLCELLFIKIVHYICMILFNFFLLGHCRPICARCASRTLGNSITRGIHRFASTSVLVFHYFGTLCVTNVNFLQILALQIARDTITADKNDVDDKLHEALVRLACGIDHESFYLVIMIIVHISLMPLW